MAVSIPAETPAAAVEKQETRLSYPETLRLDTADTLHGQLVPDPYRWLEDPDDAQVQAWMHAQDDLARGYLDRLPLRTELRDRLAALSYHDAISVPVKRNGRYFYTRRHADKEKSIVYWRQGADGAETVLIDPHTLSEDGSVSLGGVWPSEDGRKVAYKLRPNNADAATMYVMDVDTGVTSDIDVIEGAKYARASWTPDGKGFYYTKLPTDPRIPVPELPGHAHVRYHALGQPPDRDPLVYPATRSAQTFVNGSVTRDGRYLVVTIAHGWNSNDLYIKDLKATGRRKAVPKGAPAWQHHGFEPLVVGMPALFAVESWRGSLYVRTNHEAPRYRLFKVDPRRMAMRHWREIVAEDAAVLQNFGIMGEHLVLTYLRNAYNHLEVRTLDGHKVREVKLPGVGRVSRVLGNEDDDEAFYEYTSFTEPPQVYRTSIKTGETELWGKVEVPVDTSNLIVEQVWYPSKDGTRVSMFIVRKRDAAPDGKNPTLLHGYGGFNVSMMPSFSARIAVWVERGGIYAMPNLRGGGEYGEAWHKAGMLLEKQTTFDDFVHAARYLIDAGWTAPDRLSIYGGSNGGLLVGAAMTQAPELFRAVVCAVPLLDMVRYHLFGSGKTWIPEYGSADDPEQFAAIIGYSPYHQVSQGTRYPALLMLSADSDDRVDPMHARKFVAAVQWAQEGEAPALLRIERNAGHGGADLVRQRVDQDADMLAFLAAQLR